MMTDDIKETVKDVAAEKAHDAHQAVNKTTEKLSQGLSYMQDKTNEVVDRAKQVAGRFAGKAQDGAERFQDQAEDLLENGHDKAREVRDEFLSSLESNECGCPAALFARQRPLLGLALAALVGFVLGRIIRRRG